MIRTLAAVAVLGATPVPAAPQPEPTNAEHQIRAQRAAFNDAIAKGDLDGIAAVLADDVQLISGTDSKLSAGKSAQLAIWSQDLRAPSRGIYVRTPKRISVSPLVPIALETGGWRGIDSKSVNDWASGEYVAKWRRIGGRWLVESETYMTTACGGSYCPKMPK